MKILIASRGGPVSVQESSVESPQVLDRTDRLFHLGPDGPCRRQWQLQDHQAAAVGGRGLSVPDQERRRSIRARRQEKSARARPLSDRPFGSRAGARMAADAMCAPLL